MFFDQRKLARASRCSGLAPAMRATQLDARALICVRAHCGASECWFDRTSARMVRALACGASKTTLDGTYSHLLISEARMIGHRWAFLERGICNDSSAKN